MRMDYNLQGTFQRNTLPAHKISEMYVHRLVLNLLTDAQYICLAV